MKALRWHTRRDLRIDDIDSRAPGAGEVRINVAWCGICGTDLHEYNAGPVIIPTEAPHPLTGETAPVVLGHELSGTIAEVGEGVTEWKVGDRVTVEPLLFNPDSPSSRQGDYHLCEDGGLIGISGIGGGFAEEVTLSEKLLHRLPDEVSLEQGALVEPVAVAVHAVRSSAFKPGDRVAIFGAGAIGLMLVETLKAAGAQDIYVVQRSEARRRKAEEMGAITIDPSAVDPVEKLIELTNGGVDVAFEVTGASRMLQASLSCTRSHGQTVVVSVWEEPATVQPNVLLLKERNVMGVFAYRNVFPTVISLMKRGFFKTEDFVTARIPLADAIEEGFERLNTDKTQVKVLVSPSLA